MKQKLNDLARQEKFVYDDAKHLYTLAGRRLESTTKFVGKQFAEFDPTMAARHAKKNGLTEAAVKSDWAHKGLVGRECGSLTHEWLERKVSGDATRPCDVSNMHKDSISKFLELKARGIPMDMLDVFRSYGLAPVMSEASLWGSKLGGTIDILAKDAHGGYWLVDWKTGDKDITATYGKQRALTIIGHMPDNDLSKYTLQLAVYHSMLRRLLGIELTGTLIIKGGLDGVCKYELPWEEEWLDLLTENT